MSNHAHPCRYCGEDLNGLGRAHGGLEADCPKRVDPEMRKEAIPQTLCPQCDALCGACANGQPHMNNELPWPGYTEKSTGQVDWQEHNRKGKHHVLWDGVSNQMVLCGSPECNRLALLAIRQRQYSEDASPSHANERQVAGDHYAGVPVQHWDIVVMHDLDYFQGQIIKYVMRHKKKNGIQDLEKAAHFLEKYIEVEKRRLGQ
jgi:hypothetical protein